MCCKYLFLISGWSFPFPFLMSVKEQKFLILVKSNIIFSLSVAHFFITCLTNLSLPWNHKNFVLHFSLKVSSFVFHIKVLNPCGIHFLRAVKKKYIFSFSMGVADCLSSLLKDFKIWPEQILTPSVHPLAFPLPMVRKSLLAAFITSSYQCHYCFYCSFPLFFLLFLSPCLLLFYLLLLTSGLTSEDSLFGDTGHWSRGFSFTMQY